MKRPPKDTEASARMITRRGLILGASQIGFMGLLGLRMRYLQVDQADQFRLLAEENRINIHLLPPARGLIHDRNGVPLAQNQQNYRVVVRREDARDLENVLLRLSNIVPLTQEDIDRIQKELRRAGPSVPVTIADRLSWEIFSEVAINAPALPGITLDVGLSRLYPLKGDLAHVVGYVGPVSDYDLSKLEDPDPLLRIPRFQIGKFGVEAKTEMELRGTAGTKRVEVNATGRIIREIDRKEGDPGNALQLTIDARLQNYAHKRLEGLSASAIVMDVRNGDLLACASAPSFDPNKFVKGISVPDYRELTEDKYRPLASKTVQDRYPPGSTFKMITLLAALDAGVISAEETIRCRGHIEMGGRRFHCWKRGGHGNVNLHNSLKKSCDVYYYELAQRVGIDKIAEMAKLFGFGQKFDVPLSAVSSGTAPNKEWKQRVYQKPWVIGDSLNASIGQGFVLATPLQVAVLSARLATGRSVSPRLIASVNGVQEPPRSGEPLGLNENHLRYVRKAMFGVCNETGGTGYGSRIVEDAYRMAGKSGTSQTRSRVVNNANAPWEERDHALFTAFGPYENPSIAVAVVVEHGGGGSSAAAPVVRDIALQAFYGGNPPLSAYPAKDRARISAQQEEYEAHIPPFLKQKSDRA
ncbi:penicillin-binding protein 2 [Halocynthiibacter sp. C4]|uniref:penicillin-binding protein 2 n=1 Tax=Halocynthiibacter sp. C4 TaxID=2992758 RepID=UPI00237A28D7|nr:penicillin-binding protein 2 [Halocynthiibacter sp. C4]MDE0590500.1 penicillin-binding protein 2 [Halocynthiibacter sp. C4]